MLGATGEGKSRFLQYLIRKDIDRLKAGDERACSLCFIDPTPQGKNALQILDYCASIGFRKVLLIDPFQIRAVGKVPPINPFNYDHSYIEMSVDYLEDAFRVLFEVKDASLTQNINTYLHAVFMILHFAGMTLYDLIWFSAPARKKKELLQEYEAMRMKMYAIIEGKIDRGEIPKVYHQILEKHIDEVEKAYENYAVWKAEISSTARRLNQLINNLSLRLIFGHRKGVKFDRLVSDGWVILVNVSTGEGLGTLQSRLLATVIINQIISTIERLRRHGLTKPYYLYLDEAQRYATDKLIEVLDQKRNIDLRMILSAHSPRQFPPDIRRAVNGQTKTKVAFYVEEYEDRMDIAHQFYGGKLEVKDVEYALRQLEKREAVFKLGKAGSLIAKTHDTTDVPQNSEFLKTLLAHRNYATIEEITKDYDERFEGDNPVRAASGTQSQHRPNNKGDGSKTKHRPKSPARPETPPGKTETVRSVDAVFLAAKKLKGTDGTDV